MKKARVMYAVICEEWTEEDSRCPCYGLRYGTFTIHFISTDRRFVEHLAAILNRLQAGPEQALDMIEHLLP